MIKKLGAFLFACSLSASYAIAAGDSSACVDSCYKRYDICVGHFPAPGTHSPICDSGLSGCLRGCGQ